MALEVMNSHEQLPAYHEGTLIVKMHPEAADLAATFATAAKDLPPSSSLSALSYLQKSFLRVADSLLHHRTLSIRTGRDEL
jgi:hypothetical protein